MTTIVAHRRKIVELTKQLKSMTDRYEKFKQTLEGRNKILMAGFNQVLDARDEELAEAQKKITHVEEALRVKTLQWQELHQNFEQHQQDCTRLLKEEQENVKGHQAKVRMLQDTLMFEKTAARADREKVEKLKRQLKGRSEPEYTPDVRRHHLIQEVKQAAEIYGEESGEYKALAKKLDRLLKAEAVVAENIATNPPHVTSVEP